MSKQQSQNAIWILLAAQPGAVPACWASWSGSAAEDESKTTRLWILVAAILLAFIFFYQRRSHKLPAGPIKPLSDLKATDIKQRPSPSPGRGADPRRPHQSDLATH